jgi:DNA-binding CsgD family transcriptional regulator/tetratricopeptide (TPR) repeat protein
MSARFIGRTTELAIVDDLLARVGAGEPATMLIAGDAGVGKTRLIEELARRARDRGFLVLSGGCLELCEGAIPMAPIVEALRRLREQLPAEEYEALLGESGAELRFLVPEAGALSAPSDTRPSPGRLLELLLALVEQLAARQPTVLVCEDLHWADQSTLELLSFLDRNLGAPVLLVGTFRSDELHRRHPLRPFIAELERSGSTTRVDLAPFARSELAAQVEAITDHVPSPGQLDELARRTEGNPFFVEELLAAASADRTRLPESLRDILLGRVADLPERERAVLRLASTLGVRVDDQLLRRLAEADEEDLDQSLHVLVDGHLLVPEPSVDGYRFRHALLQEAIYDELLPGERRRLHARIAEAIAASEQTDAITLAELAHHWYRARMLPEALAASVRAGRAAACIGAPAEALTHYERAIELWDAVPDAESRAGVDHVELMTLAAEQADMTGTFERAIALVRAALDEIDTATDPVRAGVLHERLGRFLWAGDQDGLPDHEEALRLVPPEPPSAERARVLGGYAQILMLSGDETTACEAACEAVEMAVRVGSRDAEGHARNTLGTCLVTLGRTEEGLAELRESLAIADETESFDDAGRARVNLSHGLSYVARWDELLDVCTEGVELARRMGVDRTYGVYIENNMLDGLIALGRWDEAAHRERSIVARLPDGYWEYINGGALAADRGDFEWARQSEGQWDRLGYVASTFQGMSDVAAGSIALGLWEGRPDDARGPIDAVLERVPDTILRWRGGELLWRGAWAEAEVSLRALDRHDEPAQLESSERAAGYLAQIEDWISGPSPHGVVTTAMMAVWHPLAVAEVARGRRADEPAHWQAAIDAAARLSVAFPSAYASWRLAEALVRTGGTRADASAALAAAYGTAVALGAAPLVREIVDLGQRARLDLEVAVVELDETDEPATADEGPLPALSPREREVLTLVAAGRTNRQIADALFISPKTASVHVSNILSKLGVSTRGEAAAVAHRLGVASG